MNFSLYTTNKNDKEFAAKISDALLKLTPGAKTFRTLGYGKVEEFVPTMRRD